MSSSGAAFLIRANTSEVIKITGDSLKIGRDNPDADYEIAGNETVSRLHATVVSKDGAYYVSDNGSTNKTYVNGAELMPFEKTTLVSGSRIRIGDEVFIFYIVT